MKGARIKTIKYKGKITNKNDIKTTYQQRRCSSTHPIYLQKIELI